MEKIRMHTINKVDENVEKIGDLFPNCVTEAKVDGKLTRVVDFDLLKQELSSFVVEGNEERYQFTWPDKKKSILLANAPITKTLRPCREESLDFDNTGNLYIEGDNLEALKLLQETYLGKVKMIYIDPPYNTGNDFVYEDNFAQSTEEYLSNSGQFDEDGNRLVKNIETNGRYHTDWLNMIYPRLKVSKDLLTEDGVVFISINDREVHALRSICNEIFGECNFIATLIWDRNHSAQAGIYKVYHEYVLLYGKNIDTLGTPKSLNSDLFEAGAMKKASGRHSMQEFTFPVGTRFDALDGTELSGEWGGIEKVVLVKGKLIAKDGKTTEDVTLKAAYTQISQMKEFFYGNKELLVDSRGQEIVEFYLSSTGKVKVVKKRGVEAPQTTCKFGSQGPISNELAKLFETEDAPFDSPKPIGMIKDFVARFTNENESEIILDFFSGSATTAHAIMELNSMSSSSNRKYILIQIPEDLDYSLEHASKDGKKTLQTAISYLDRKGLPHLLTEIGKERIRLAGAKIKETAGFTAQNLDTGFRVLKVDSTNMKDVFYTPDVFDRTLFDDLTDNIKEDRTPLDLLFQVMLEMDVLLSSKIVETEISGKKVYSVMDDYMIACFDTGITSEVVEAIAKKQPYYAVFRDSCMADDSTMASFEQIFKTYSKDTIRKVL
ncbi:MAG: DNA methyltransferase [Angelakisella sp.]|nr:DNA methyltransferase [Angelakisella sp.]